MMMAVRRKRRALFVTVSPLSFRIAMDFKSPELDWFYVDFDAVYHSLLFSSRYMKYYSTTQQGRSFKSLTLCRAFSCLSTVSTVLHPILCILQATSQGHESTRALTLS